MFSFYFSILEIVSYSFLIGINEWDCEVVEYYDYKIQMSLGDLKFNYINWLQKVYKGWRD